MAKNWTAQLPMKTKTKNQKKTKVEKKKKNSLDWWLMIDDQYAWDVNQKEFARNIEWLSASGDHHLSLTYTNITCQDRQAIAYKQQNTNGI